MPNPFQAKLPVDGEDFIGREEHLQKLYTKVFEGVNVAIRGLSKIGKTSLAQKIISEARHRSSAEWCFLSVMIATQGFHNPKNFFISITARLIEAAEAISHPSLDLLKSQQEKILEHGEWDDIKWGIERFIKILYKKKIKPIVILDEFDASRTLFPGHSNLFGALTSFASDNPEKFILVTTSRRSLAQIAQEIGDNSNLPGIFYSLDLAMFSSEDCLLFKNKVLTECGLEEADWPHIEEICGGHPYLLNCLAERLYDRHAEGVKPAVFDSYHDIMVVFKESFEHIFRHLSEEERGTLERIVKSPGCLFKYGDLAQLVKYGLIKVTRTENDKEDNVVRSAAVFSQAFARHLGASTGDETPIIDHAGDLAHLILEHHKLKQAVAWAEGSEKDWFEWKEILLPFEESVPNKDEYIWDHALKPIITMANTRGGCILIGVKDKTGEIVGVKKPDDMPAEEYIRRYVTSNLAMDQPSIVKNLNFSKKKNENSNKFTQYAYTIQRPSYVRQPLIKLVSLAEEGPHVVMIIVWPIPIAKEGEEQAHLWEITTRENGGESHTYPIGRDFNAAQTLKLDATQDREDHQKNRARLMDAGLKEIWQEIKAMT